MVSGATLDAEIRRFATHVFQLHDTSKCESIPTLMAKYAGREGLMCKKLIKKYKIRKSEIPQKIRNLLGNRPIVVGNVHERQQLAGEIARKHSDNRRRRSMSPAYPIFSPIAKDAREASRSRPRNWDDAMNRQRSRPKSSSKSRTPRPRAKSNTNKRVNFSKNECTVKIETCGEDQLDNIVFGEKFARLSTLCKEHGISFESDLKNSTITLTGNKKGISAVKANINIYKDILEDAQQYLTSTSPARTLSKRAG